MSKKSKTILFTAIFAVFLLGSLLLYNALKDTFRPEIQMNYDKDAPSDEKEKTKAPDFTVLDQEGNEVKLSDMEGKPVVINFWASWCSPCKDEMPHFENVYNELGDSVQFMMIDLADGFQETIESGTAYFSEHGFLMPLFFDTTGEASGKYGITGIPTTIFIDKDGYLITHAVGGIDEELLRKGIELTM